MKKLLFGSIVLFMFSISLTLFQISCSKQTNAQTRTTSATQLNKVVYSQQNAVGIMQIWTANYDGTNQAQVPVVLPANIYIDSRIPQEAVRLSPDGLTIFFVGGNATTPAAQSSIYACNIDGSNCRLVIPAGSNLMRLEGVY